MVNTQVRRNIYMRIPPLRLPNPVRSYTIIILVFTTRPAFRSMISLLN
jgi:hypothetical protein